MTLQGLAALMALSVGCAGPWRETKFTPWLFLDARDGTAILPHSVYVGGGHRIRCLRQGRWLVLTEPKRLEAIRLEGAHAVLVSHDDNVDLLREDTCAFVRLPPDGYVFPLPDGSGVIVLRCADTSSTPAFGRACKRATVQTLGLDGAQVSLRAIDMGAAAACGWYGLVGLLESDPVMAIHCGPSDDWSEWVLSPKGARPLADNEQKNRIVLWPEGGVWQGWAR